nr:hypothetical protein [uncultured Rhodopila sp.]
MDGTAEQAAEAAEQTAEIAAAEAGAAEVATAKVAAVDLLVAGWMQDMIHNSPAARDTAGYNHLVQHALPELRRRILKGAA